MALNARRVLVTGASGFVGGALARALADEGAFVQGLVRQPSRAGYIANYPNITLITGDLSDVDSLRRAVSGVEVVFHVAAAMGGALAKQEKINVEGTRVLAQLAADAGVRRFVHVSSVAVYGFAGLPDRVTEDIPLPPVAYAYSITKRRGEDALREVAAQTGLEFSIIRPGMIYGPRSNPWTVQMFKLSRRFGTPFIGDGRGHVMPIHIDDVCALTMLLAEHPNAAGEAFNCTPDPGISWREFLSAYARLKGHSRWLGIPERPVFALAPIIATLAPGGSLMKDLRDLLPLNLRPITYSMEKARTRLGWGPQVTFEQGIQSTVPYLKEIRLL